jgi:hypothetical protein
MNRQGAWLSASEPRNCGYPRNLSARKFSTPARYEPATTGFGKRSGVDPNANAITTFDAPKNALAFCWALLEQESPDLALIVEAWGTLPPALKVGIVAMVRHRNPS